MDNPDRTVEVFTKYTAIVAELTDAFAFVMERIDRVENPQVAIAPFWTIFEDHSETRRFEVSVSGHSEEKS